LFSNKKGKINFNSITSIWNSNSSKAIKKEKAVVALLIAGVILVSGFLFAILFDIIIKGAADFKIHYLFEEQIGVGVDGGFLNAIIGSLQLVGIAILIAFPLALGSAIYVQEYAKKDNIFTKIIMFTSDTLASTPSVVFGAFGFIFFSIYLDFGVSLLAGGFTLAFMILPILLRSCIEAIKSVPFDYQEGSFALGATKWQTIKNVVLPPAFPMISSGVIIGIGRAIGETAAVLFTAGYSAHIVTSILKPAANLPNMIFQYFGKSALYPGLADKLYSVSLVLIIMVLVLNAIARFSSYKSRKMIKN
jgi:phosphate transport system permease protein